MRTHPQELQELSGKDMLHLTSQTLGKLLPALNECTEWGQVRARRWRLVQGQAARGRMGMWAAAAAADGCLMLRALVCA